MKKSKKGRKLSRKRNQRRAILKNLAESLILKEKIKTTQAKAKEISKFVEKKITQAKTGNLTSQRLLAKFFSPKTVKKLVQDIALRYKQRKGGYTRIIKLGKRKSNGAKMVMIELVK